MDYFVPDTLKQAEDLKKKSGKRYIYFAGGTILNWRGSPKADGLIDLKNLHLEKINIKKAKIKIGAMATISDVADNINLPESLSNTAKSFKSINIRNMATVGGTIAGKFFISDLIPLFLAFKASVEFFFNGESKTLPLGDWLLDRQGLVCGVVITEPGRIVKVKRQTLSAIDFPQIVTGIGFKIKNFILRDPVIAISGATAKTETLDKAEEYLAGKEIKDIDLKELNQLIQKEIRPVKSLKASSLLKRRFIENHVKEIFRELSAHKMK